MQSTANPLSLARYISTLETRIELQGITLSLFNDFKTFTEVCRDLPGKPNLTPLFHPDYCETWRPARILDRRPRPIRRRHPCPGGSSRRPARQRSGNPRRCLAAPRLLSRPERRGSRRDRHHQRSRRACDFGARLLSRRNVVAPCLSRKRSSGAALAPRALSRIGQMVAELSLWLCRPRPSREGSRRSIRIYAYAAGRGSLVPNRPNTTPQTNGWCGLGRDDLIYLVEHSLAHPVTARNGISTSCVNSERQITTATPLSVEPGISRRL